MDIEVWSDVACPWCLIGKKRLERALRARPALTVTLRYRSYELDPHQRPLPPGDGLVAVLARKYGIPEQRARAMMDHVAAQAAAEGVEMDFEAQRRESGSFDAHRLLQLAHSIDPALQADLKEGLMRARFCEGRSIREPASLKRLALAAGLPADAVDRVLDTPDAFARNVREDEAMARAMGVTGVPFFVFDRKLALSGAQPVEAFHRALDRIAPESAGSACAVETT